MHPIDRDVKFSHRWRIRVSITEEELYRGILFVPPDFFSSLLSGQVVEGSMLITSVGSLVLWLRLAHLVGSRRWKGRWRVGSGYLFLMLYSCRLPQVAYVLHPRASAVHRAASSMTLLDFSNHSPTPFTLLGPGVVTALLLLAIDCCAILFISPAPCPHLRK